MGMAESGYCAFRRFVGDSRMFWCDWKRCRCERFTVCKNPPNIEVVQMHKNCEAKKEGDSDG